MKNKQFVIKKEASSICDEQLLKKMRQMFVTNTQTGKDRVWHTMVKQLHVVYTTFSFGCKYIQKLSWLTCISKIWQFLLYTFHILVFHIPIYFKLAYIDQQGHLWLTNTSNLQFIIFILTLLHHSLMFLLANLEAFLLNLCLGCIDGNIS